MKNLFILLFVMAFFALSCAGEREKSTSETESFTGFIFIEGSILTLDAVEIITPENTERVAELGLTQQSDMPNGYYIYNSDKEKITYELSDETVYSFVDSNLLFVNGEDGNRFYTTTKTEEFIQHLNTSYFDSPPAQKVPFVIEVSAGKVLSILEKFEFTV